MGQKVEIWVSKLLLSISTCGFMCFCPLKSIWADSLYTYVFSSQLKTSRVDSLFLPFSGQIDLLPFSSCKHSKTITVQQKRPWKIWKALFFRPIKVLNSWVNQLIISYLYMRALQKPSSLERYKINISYFYAHSVLEWIWIKSPVPCDRSIKGDL